MRRQAKWLSGLMISTMLLAACGKDAGKKDQPDNPQDADIYGVVQKGPFVRGSKVTVSELDNHLNPTGKVYTTLIQNDKGEFTISGITLQSNYVQIVVDGYFYNEVTGKLSDSQLTLFSISDTQSKHSMNVNVLTHIENDRVINLVKKEGKSFSEAKTQALKEVLSAFYINDKVSSSDSFDLSANTKESHMLLAISSLLIADRTESELTQFLSMLSEDVADNGKIDNQTTKETIRLNSMDMYTWKHVKYEETIDPEYREPSQNIAKVKVNTVARYKSLGIEIDVRDFERYIDADGDGNLSNNKQLNLPALKFENITDVTKTDNLYFSNEITFDKIERDVLIWLPSVYQNYEKNNENIVPYSTGGGSAPINWLGRDIYQRFMSRYSIIEKYSILETNFERGGEQYFTFLSNGQLIAKYAGSANSNELSSVSMLSGNYLLFINDKPILPNYIVSQSAIWIHKGDRVKLAVNPYLFLFHEYADKNDDSYDSKYNPLTGTEIIPDNLYSGRTSQATLFVEGERLDFSVSLK